MAFDIEGAKNAGYTDTEIAQYLSKNRKFNYNGAKNEGYSDYEIIDYLIKKPISSESKPSFTQTVAQHVYDALTMETGRPDTPEKPVKSNIPPDMQGYSPSVNPTLIKSTKPLYNAIRPSENRLPELTGNKPIQKNIIQHPYVSPEQEALETPWVDPVTAAVGGFAAPVKAGAGIVRGLVSSGLSAITDYPIGVATELVEKKNPYLAMPFAVITGMVSGMTLERAIENKIIHALAKKGIKPAQKVIDDIGKQVKSAIDAGQPNEADNIIRNLASVENVPIKANADMKNVPTVETPKRYIVEEPKPPTAEHIPSPPPKGIEHPKIQPNEKINSITLDEAGKLIAKGDPEVIHHIQEGVDKLGAATLQDAIKSVEGEVMQKAKKGEERSKVIENIQQIEPDINAALKGETTPSIPEPPKPEPMTAKIKDLKNIERESYQKMKDWLNNNVDHWTWITTNPEYMQTVYRDRIDSNKVTEFDILYKNFRDAENKKIERLKQFINKKDLKDFSEQDLNETISYSDMNIATDWRNIRDNAENNVSDWLLENGAERIIKRFKSRKDAEKYAIENNLDLKSPIGTERIFFRKGKPPESGKSYNSMDNKYESGVSVYVTPKVGSWAGHNEKDIYYGKGRQIGTGGDDEPVIIITDKWKKFDLSKINAALKGEVPPPHEPPKSPPPIHEPLPATENIAKVEKIKIVKDVMKFTQSQRQTLQQAIKDISSGELVKNQGLKDREGYYTGETLQGASMYPEWFKNKGYTAKNVLNALKKALNGQPLTKNQQVIVEDINQGIRKESAEGWKHARKYKEVNAWDLQEGQTFTKDGEKFKVVNKDDSGFLPEVTIKDGETIKITGDETVKFDRGTLKQSEKPKTDFVPTDIKGEEQGIWRGKGFNPEMPTEKIKSEYVNEKDLPLFAGEQKPETETQQGLFNKPPVPSSTTAADLGGYAPPRGTAASHYNPPEGLFAMEMPEIVELAKDISGGKYPQVKAKLSNRLAAGLFRTSTGRIELKADIFKNPDEAQKVLSHEIGHMVDWIPDKDMSRGNILGRIASLKKYMSKLLEEYPDSPNLKLTPEDRARIRNEAVRLAKVGSKYTIEVEEQLIKEVPLKADDIMKIMNDVGGEVRATDKKLYEWFAMLSGAEKKSILIEALKGRVPDWVSFKRTVIEGVKTVKKTIYEPVDPRKTYHDMIIEEIKKRRLYQYETIMSELKSLSKEWKPFDESKVHQKYINYRYSSKELYADSISVLFNDPELLKQKAPTYYKAFFAYLENKPEVSAIYEDIQNRLKLGYEDIFRQRNAKIETMFRRGEQAYSEALKKPPLQVWKSLKKSMVDVNTEAIHLVKEVEKRGIKIPSESNPRYWIEELPYMSGPVKDYYTKIENLVRNTASDVEIGKYMLAGRSQTERAKLANPLGMQQKNAIDYIEYLKAKDPERHARVEEALSQFRKLRATQIIPEIESAEMFDDEMIKLMRDNEHYATFDIVKYIEKRFGRNISSYIHKQVGTLEDTANPFTATIMKDTAMLRNAHITKSKKVMVSFLQQTSPENISPADTRWNGRYHEVIEPKDPNKGLVAYLHKGKVQGYYVDKEIADTFYKDPYKGGIILKAWMTLSQPLKDLLVSKNPWFMLWNIQRDLRASAKQLPGASIPKILYYGLKSAPDAYKDVIKNIHTPDVSEMYKGKMLITGRAYGKDISPDSQLERMMQEFLIKPQEYNNKVIAPLKKFWDFLDKPGQFSERLFKIAGYKYLKENTSLPDKEIAHLVRTRAGSPDFMRGGQHRLIYNNVFLFSNAGKEGWRSSIEAYKENPTRYIWKTIEYDILPKAMMFAGAAGLFGDDIKKWFQKIPERDKANYQIVPIGETQEGIPIYLRIPHDFTGQAISGMAWKIMNDSTNYQDLLDYMSGGLPYTGLHPFIGLTVDTYQYMTGKNPYNTFTGRYVIPEQIHEAGGIRAAEEFGKHAANQLGIGIIYKFKGADLRQASSELEKLIGYPIVGRGIERFLKVSDYGLTERIQKEVVKPIRQERAKENIAISDRIIEDVRSKTSISENDIKQLYIQLRKEGILTRKEYSDFRETYKLMAMRKVGDPYIKAYMTAKSNEEKMGILNMMMKEKGANK